MTAHLKAVEDKPDAFEEFWALYPHHPKRKTKAAARELFNKITAPGGIDTRTQNKDSGSYIDIHLEATAEEILEGVKAYRKDATNRQTFKVDTEYSPNAVVWLNQGRWEQ